MKKICCIIILWFAVCGIAVLARGSASADAPRKPTTTPTASQRVPDELEARLAHLQKRVSPVAFCVHTVRLRENLWKIASRNRYSVHTLIGCNPQLQTYDVSVGQRIIIPSRPGTLHRIQSRETWQQIADRYKMPGEQIRRNNPGVAVLVTGEYLFIPDRRPDMELMNDGMRKRYELRALFTSPLGGRLSSLFGMRRHPVTGGRAMHGGIDIAVRNGSWVGAAADGVVTVASSGIGHYGTAVFIDHEDGYETQYGHLSRICVRPGQRVKARQLIAKSGSTGRVTGPHLHFTIKKNGVSKDPLKYIW